MKLTPYIDLIKCLWHVDFRSKDKELTPQKSFEICLVSAPWPRVHSTDMQYTFQTIHSQVKMSIVKVILVIWNETHTGHLKFLSCPIHGFLLIWLNNFICGIHTTHERAMCLATFPGRGGQRSMWHVSFNTLRPRQNGRHFPDDIFKCLFLNENVRISIKISLKFVPGGPNNNFPALVQIMAWRRPGDTPLSELTMFN